MIPTGALSGLLTHIATTESGLLCGADDKLSAFVELERQVLTVTFYLASIRRGFVPRPMTLIEIRPCRNGWKCFEAPGVEPVFLNQEDAIGYATGRACFRSGEIRILDSSGAVARVIPFNDVDRKL